MNRDGQKYDAEATALHHVETEAAGAGPRTVVMALNMQLVYLVETVTQGVPCQVKQTGAAGAVTLVTCAVFSLGRSERLILLLSTVFM